ncbi:MAG: hypothetical protein IPH54_06995 [Rhodoferax sp.]|nr:hypothetical protein [Rhodoferax sp.]
MITTPDQQTTQPPTITAAQIESQRRDGIRYSFGKFAQREGVPELMAQCFNNPALTVQDANHKLLAHLEGRLHPHCRALSAKRQQ